MNIAAKTLNEGKWQALVAQNHQLAHERRERERAEFERTERESAAAQRLWGPKANERLRTIREYLAQTPRRSKRHRAIAACLTADHDAGLRAAWNLIQETTP